MTSMLPGCIWYQKIGYGDCMDDELDFGQQLANPEDFVLGFRRAIEILKEQNKIVGFEGIYTEAIEVLLYELREIEKSNDV